jgi:PAS domain S-box-containing protein
MLASWIDEHPRYTLVDPDEDIEVASFDLAIIDKAALNNHLDALRSKKTAADPVLLPYLLLVPDTDTDIIETDAGQLADNVLTETIDELVSLPIQQAELHWRLTALLRLRNQSLTLRTREQELERQVDLFEKAEDIANVGAWEYDIETGEAWWTEEVYCIYGLPTDKTPTPEEGLEYYHQDDRQTVRDAFEAAVEGGDSYDIEVRLIDETGAMRWVRTRGEPQYVDGEPVRVRGTIQDITERKERERDLETIQQAVDASGHSIFITDTEGIIQYVNTRFEKVTGYSSDEVIGKTPQVLDSGQMSKAYFDDLWATLEEGDIWSEEIVNRKKNGETYTAMQTIAPVTDGDETHAYVAVHDDITERKQREQTLELRTKAIESAPVGITITDPDQEDNPLIYVNEAFESITGYTGEGAIGRNCRFLQGDETDPEVTSRIRSAIDAAEPVSVDIRNYRQDGSEFWNHLEIAPVRNESGEVVNYIGFQQDITERKFRQRQLGVLDRVLRHNLRNDMNVIRGMAEMIHRGAEGEVATHAKQIMTTSDRLIGLADKERKIAELLQKTPTKQSIELEGLMTQAISTVQAEYPEATIDLECPPYSRASATPGLEEAVTELVTNAIIHNDSDSPMVTITATPEDETVWLTIADNGPQIPDMERGLLTDSAAETPLYHGSGLGLWLVQLIVSRSGGDITIEDNDPVGNVVRLGLQNPQ